MSLGIETSLAPPGQKITQVLEACKRIAVYGVSENPSSPSHKIAKFLKAEGYRVVPIGTYRSPILQSVVYPEMAAVSGRVDMVAVFPETPNLEEALIDAVRFGVSAVWFQKGARGRAWLEPLRKLGLEVIYDRCLRSEYLSRWTPVVSLYTDFGGSN